MCYEAESSEKWGLRRALARLVEVPDEVELADVGEVLVEHLHEQMDGLQACELILCPWTHITSQFTVSTSCNSA